MDGGVGAGRRAARRIRLGSNCLRCRRCWLTVGREGWVTESWRGGKGKGWGVIQATATSNTKRDDHPLAFSRSLTQSLLTLTAMSTGRKRV